LKRTGIIVLLVLLTLVGIPLLLLNTSYFQKKIVNLVTKEISYQTRTNITIEKSDFNLFRGIVFHEVNICDSLNQPILKAERLDAGIRILPLLRRHVEIGSIRLIHADICLNRKTPESDLNIQSILNAFKKPKKSVLPWNVDISSIILRYCRVRYDVLSIPERKVVFDANHLDLSGISAKISLKIAPKKHYQVTLDKFEGVEKSGLQIKQLGFQAKISEKTINLKDFELRTTNTRMEIDLLDAEFNGFSAFSSFSDSVRFNPTNIRLSVVPSDFACFEPSLFHLNKPISLTIAAEGKISDLTCRKLRLNMDNIVLLDGRIVLKGLPDLSNLYLNGQIEMLRIKPEGLEYLNGVITHNFTEIPLLRNLGTINYMGHFNTIEHQWILTGDFATDAGNFGTNIQLSKKNNALLYEGKINTKSFQLNVLFPENKDLGEVAFDVSVKGSQDSKNGFSGTVDGLVPQVFFHGYNYHNLTLSGEFDKKRFEGDFKLDDLNAKLDFSGLVNFSKESPEFRFDLIADGINLQALNLINKPGESNLSFHMNSNFEGMKVDELQGQLSIDSLNFHDKTEWFSLNHLLIKGGKNQDGQHLTINSPIINGEVWGKYQFSTLINGFKSLAQFYFPSLFKSQIAGLPGSNFFDFHGTIDPSPSLEKILDLPFSLQERLELQGFYNEASGKFRLKADVPKMVYGKMPVESAGILFENPLVEAKFIAYAQIGSREKQMKINLDARALNDKTNLKFNISNSGVQTYSGNIQSSVGFSRGKDGSLMVGASLKPSTLIVKDSIWQIHPTRFRWENKKLWIEDFQLTHSGQFIKIQGYASKESSDTLSVLLNSFSLDDVFLLLPSSSTSIHFGGLVSGNAKCMRLLKDPAMDADLSVRNFSFNHSTIGNLTAKSKWNNSIKALVLDAVIRSNEQLDGVNRKVATASGAFFPTSDSLFLSIDGDRLPLGFLNPYVGKILYKMEGYASGNIHLIGPVKKLGVYAKAYVEKASFGVKMLNTRYYFSDSILLSPRILVFRNVTVKDKEGNIAKATGIIRHNYFKNMQISIDVQAKNLLAMDIPPSPSAYFYGTAYGTGSVSINGPQDNILIDVNLRTEDRTKATISFLDDSEVAEYSFINFIKKKKVNTNEDGFDLGLNKKRLAIPTITTPTNLTVNLQVEATPNAELTLITDPSTGDEIKAKGSGALRVVINESEDLQLFGRYAIESGSYRFIYENLLRRDFTIENGGSITFSGDPFAAELNIKANHTVNAQLSDLLTAADLSSLNLNRSNIPVNCVLKLDGELQRPGIQLDLAYPSADDELRRRITSVINTDEMVNQQIVFLLLFGRFSTPTYNSSTSQSSTSNMSTVLNTTISTLSSQFNNLANDVLGKSNMSFDFDYRNAAYELGTPGEWKVGMSGQWLDNRLTFNGNLGSRENLAQTGSSQFIGEFDVNLKMKNSEKWSWKVFNRANDNRYFKSALNTQGAGIVYKEDYNTLGDLFRKMLKSFKKAFQLQDK